ncbi:hypothetical protein [Chitinophaga sp. Cy-1792]|uniref:hypothetical protein n=1 Tax=Chitinophaga sp. Cy-1792 TaxID=2608339 RepID=UPI0014214E33|nr:hypothetical protein [Chitinophaga sp. Cy-1792]NIG54878.1 hypothetical protein [Chitinophaga sp. Cy-1792]
MKWKKFIGPIIGLVLLYFIILRPLFINPYLLREHHEFTRGTIIDVVTGSEGSPSAVFEYTVDNKRYSGYLNLDIGINVKIGEHYNVMYYPPNPKNSELLIDHWVP